MSLSETFDRSFKDELNELGERLVGRMQEYLRREGKEASGELIRSLEYEVTEDNRLLFRATADHAIYVHEGTRGHWPPKGALRDWVQTVGFAPGLSIESRDYLARKAVSEGSKATPFIQEPLEQAATEMARNVQTRVLQDLRSEANATTS